MATGADLTTMIVYMSHQVVNIMLGELFHRLIVIEYNACSSLKM